MILQAFLYYRTYRSTRYLPRDMSLLLLEFFFNRGSYNPSLVHSIFTGRTKASHVTAMADGQMGPSLFFTSGCLTGSGFDSGSL